MSNRLKFYINGEWVESSTGETLDVINAATEQVIDQIAKGGEADVDRAKRVARHIRTGNIHLNGAVVDNQAPFGGYKKFGNGREWGAHGLAEFLEVKAIMGCNA